MLPRPAVVSKTHQPEAERVVVGTLGGTLTGDEQDCTVTHLLAKGELCGHWLLEA